MPNGDEFNGDEFGELEDLREFVQEHGDAIEQIVFMDLENGDGYANIEFEGQWYGFDLDGFDDELWEELFDFIDEYDIDYVVYEG